MRLSFICLNKRKITERLLEACLIFTVIFACTLGVIARLLSEDLSLQASTEPTKPVIVVDAGHGGEDSGAIGEGSVLEKNLNLEISFLIGEELKSRGYEVVYTRTEDKLLYKPEEDIKGIRKISDLKNRCAIANEYENFIFLSIHMNSFGAEKYSGLQVYYAPDDDYSYRLASGIQKSVKDTLQPSNRRVVKSGKDIYVLENVNGPAVLIECGFLTNAEECKKLCEKEYQKQLSFSIVCGIIDIVE